LLGPKRAGKSTTVYMVLGLSTSDTSEISVFGRSPRDAVVAGQI
jgi:ABC-2 type transport system ATP-binding protein